jgi:hypothetical protein
MAGLMQFIIPSFSSHFLQEIVAGCLQFSGENHRFMRIVQPSAISCQQNLRKTIHWLTAESAIQKSPIYGQTLFI